MSDKTEPADYGVNLECLWCHATARPRGLTRDQRAEAVAAWLKGHIGCADGRDSRITLSSGVEVRADEEEP